MLWIKSASPFPMQLIWHSLKWHCMLLSGLAHTSFEKNQVRLSRKISIVFYTISSGTYVSLCRKQCISEISLFRGVPKGLTLAGLYSQIVWILPSLSVKIFMLLDGKSSFNLKIPLSPSAPSAPHRYTVYTVQCTYSSALYTLLNRIRMYRQSS